MYRRSLVFLLREEKKKIPFKAVLDDPSVVIVDKHSPHESCRATGTSTHLSSGVVDESFGALRVDPASPALNRRFRRFRRCSSGPGVPALFWQSRRSRRYDGCPGVSGAQLAVPTIQIPRALQPVQSLIRVPSDKAIKKRLSFFLIQKK